MYNKPMSVMKKVICLMSLSPFCKACPLCLCQCEKLEISFLEKKLKIGY